MASLTIVRMKRRTNSLRRRHYTGDRMKLLESVRLFKSTVRSWACSTQQKWYPIWNKMKKDAIP